MIKAPAYYQFEWNVKDDYTYSDFGQVEARDGYHTKGNIWNHYTNPKGYMSLHYDINAQQQQSYGQEYNHNNKGYKSAY